MSSGPLLVHGRYREIAAAVAARIAARVSLEDSTLGPAIEVLVPSRGMGETIAAALIEACPQGVAGLQIDTIDSLARRITNFSGSFPAIATDAEQRLAMSLAARGIDDPFLRTPGIVPLLLRSWRDARDSGVSLEPLGEALDRLRLPALHRKRLMLRVWTRYRDELGRAGLVDPAGVYDTAIGALKEGLPLSSRIVAGFYDTTGLQQRLLEVLFERGLIEEIAVPVPLDDLSGRYRFAAPFVERMRARAAAVTAAPPVGAPPTLALAAFANRRSELHGICGAIRDLLDSGRSPQSIGISSRAVDGVLASRLARHAASFDFAIQPEPGIPATSHRILRAILLLLRLREHRFPRRDVIEILHAGIDPLGERLDRETIEEIDRLTRRYEISGGPSATVLQAIPRIESHRAESADGIRHYARIVASIERDLAPPPGPLPARRWAELLERISSGFPVETETDLAALSAIDQARETLDRYERAGALLHPQDLVQILESLGDLPDPAPPPETLPRIWFGDVMRLRGRLFDHLFLIAAEEGTFPQGRNPDALLADQERKRLGISEIGDGIDEERLLLQLTLDSSHQSLQASFAWSDDAGRAKRPSHFLQDLALERDPERSALILGNFREYVGDLRVFGPAELAAGRITRVPLTASVLASPTGDGGQPEPASGPLRRKLRLLAATGSGSIFDGYLMPGDELREAILQKMQQIPPTHLEDFGECPQRFFFKRVLGVRELEDPDHEIEIASRRKGSLRHEILEAFYRDLPEEETRAYTGGALPSALSRRLSALIEQKFQQYDRDYPAWNPLIRKIEREVTERALHRFVAEDLAEMNESGFRPRHFEYRFGAWPGSGQPPVTLRFGGVEMSLHGSIDRIDQGEDGALRVVDYKSGRAQHLKDLSDLIEAGRGLQLPLYALAAAIAFGLPDEGITAVIKPLDRKDDLERFGFALSSKRAALERVLGFFVNRAIEGIFPAFPGEKICRFCPVNQSCRSRHDAGERAAAERFQNVLDLLGGSDAEA